MPLGHKRRIFSTIHAVHGSIEDVSPIESSCHLLALMGAEILAQCYGIPAAVVPCRATYIFDAVGDGAPTNIAFDEHVFADADTENSGNGIGHSIVIASSDNPEGDAPYLIDFQSPVFNKLAAIGGVEFPYKPGLLWARNGDPALTGFHFEPSPTGEQFIQGLRVRGLYADLLSMCAAWYVKPPEKMRDIRFTDAVPGKPETVRSRVLHYTPIDIEDNIRTRLPRSIS